MKELSYLIGKNLNQTRKSLGHSLERAAQLTGVSKSMLGQIERGESNPTVSILWKIANGLEVPFASLIDEKKVKPSLIHKYSSKPIHEPASKYTVYPYLSFDPSRKFELFLFELESDAEYISEPHKDAIEEYILMVEGELIVEVNEEKFTIKKQDVLHFNAAFSHTFRNQEGKTAVAYNIITYI